MKNGFPLDNLELIIYTRNVIHNDKHYFFHLSSTLENPTIEIYSSLSGSKYYVGEDVMIRANFNNPSAILCITWQRESTTGNFGAIDTTLHKYRGTRNGTENHLLYINNCEKSDGGIYFILATCTDGMEIMSNKIYLDISEGKTYFSRNILSTAFFVDHSGIMRIE